MPALYIFDLPRASAHRNLRLEEEFLNRAERDKNDIYLMFYENLTSVILGRTGDAEADIHRKKRTPPVLRRCSGGGTVVHGAGNLNYSIIASIEKHPRLYPIRESYSLILNALCEGFKPVADLQMMGISDITCYQNGMYRKISGNSQIRRKRWLMHHGTFLYNKKSLKNINYFLKMPERKPEYRENRDHRLFMISSLPVTSRAVIKNRIIHGVRTLFDLDSTSTYYYNRLPAHDSDGGI